MRLLYVLRGCVRSLSMVIVAGVLASGCGIQFGWGADPICTALPKTRGVSESCCPTYGVDACGAGLFCAAFDGRTVATCYLERSRASGETCFEDRHCVVGLCSGDTCAHLPYEACNEGDACFNPAAPTDYYACAAVTSPYGLSQDSYTCDQGWWGVECGFCNEDADCGKTLCRGTLVCVGHRCVGPKGSQVQNMDCCLNGVTSGLDECWWCD